MSDKLAIDGGQLKQHHAARQVWRNVKVLEQRGALLRRQILLQQPEGRAVDVLLRRLQALKRIDGHQGELKQVG